jgi:hypothetical protein
MCRPHPYALPAPVATEVLRLALRQKTIPHLDDVLEDFGERSLLSVIVQLNYYFTLRAPGARRNAQSRLVVQRSEGI